jgi:hypothetical protein
MSERELDPFRPTTQPVGGPIPFDDDRLQQAYQRLLGRPAGDYELDIHRGNPGGLEGALGAVVNSPEARDYAARPATPPPAAAPATPPAGGALGGVPNLPGRRGSWGNLALDAPTQTNPGQFRGFNDERALAGGDDRSVKDAFRRFMGGQSFNPQGQSKEQIDAFLTSLIPAARQYGLNILDVNGDQILIETRERGPEWVDIVQNAGGDDSAWQWLTQQEFGNTDNGGFGGAFGQLQGMPGGSDILQALLMDGGLGGSDLMTQIQAELQKLLAGQAAGPTAQAR